MERALILSILPFRTDIVAGTVAPASWKMYERDILVYLKFAKTQEQALAPSTLARWRTHLVNETTYSPFTINRMMSSVRAMMQAAAEQRYLSHEQAESFSNVRGVSMNALKERKKPHARVRISPEEMQRLTAAPDPSTLLGLRDRALLHTLASSGIRVSEVAKLTVDRVKREGKEYYLEVWGKNDEDYRRALLSHTAYEAIQAWLKQRNTPCAYIFTSFTNQNLHSREKAMSAVAVWKSVRRYAKACGLEWIKPHDFRRFVGTQLARKDIRKAQQALGHKRIETTTQYDLGELELGITNNLY